MKKISQLLLTDLCLVGLLAACAGDEGQLREYAQGYLDALGNYRPTEARPYASPETCEKTLAFYEALMSYTDSSVFKNNIPATITLGETSYSNDTCATVAFHKSTPITEQDGTLHMVKRGRKWLAHEVINFPSAQQSAVSGKQPIEKYQEQE
ncbi:MAG: hypothetical protein IJ785_07280 [Bacteroidales bacterium]|nr:hypothetical protein [Bacteroidales bacterium]